MSEVGFELQDPAEYGPAVYAAVIEAGQEFGIRRMGAAVVRAARLHRGKLPRPGDQRVLPLAGRARLGAHRQPGPRFPGPGRLGRREGRPRRVLRTLEWDSDDVADVYASLFRAGPNYT